MNAKRPLLIALVTVIGILSAWVVFRLRGEQPLPITPCGEEVVLQPAPRDKQDDERPTASLKGSELRKMVSVRAMRLLAELKPHGNLSRWLAAQQQQDSFWNAGEGATEPEEDSRVAATALALRAVGYKEIYQRRHLVVDALAKLQKKDGRLCQDQTANALAAFELGGLVANGQGHRAGQETFDGLERFAYASQTVGGGWPARVGEKTEDFFSTICWSRATEYFGRRDETERFGRDLRRWGKQALRTATGDKVLLPMVTMFTQDRYEGLQEYHHILRHAVKTGVPPAPPGSFALAMMAERGFHEVEVEDCDVLMDCSLQVYNLIASKIQADGSWPDDPQVGPERRLWGRTGQAALAFSTLDASRWVLESRKNAYWLPATPEEREEMEKAARGSPEQKNSLHGVVPPAPRK